MCEGEERSDELKVFFDEERWYAVLIIASLLRAAVDTMLSLSLHSSCNHLDMKSLLTCSAHPGLGCDVLYGVLQTSPITNPVDGSNTAARMLSVPPSIERTKGVGFWEVVERMKGVLRRKMIKIRKRGECN